MNKYLLTISLVLTTLTSLTGVVMAQRRYGPTIRVEHDTDRQGGDYKSFEANFLDCYNACANDPNCKAFTVVSPNRQPPNYNNRNHICWLKNTVPGKRIEEGMVSGVKEQV